MRNAANQSPAQDEDTLWHEVNRDGSSQARLALFDKYTPLARSVARQIFHQYAGENVELEDLEQYAIEGMLQAVDRFDPTRGIPFSAFARKRIAGAVRDGLARSSERLEQQSFRRRLRKDRMDSLIAARGDAGPGDDLNLLSELAVALALGFMLEDAGLASSASGEEISAYPFGGYDTHSWRELVNRLDRDVDRLEHRERMIIREHYLNGVSFDNLASLLGVSKGRISQMHRASLASLRKRLHQGGHFALER